MTRSRVPETQNSSFNANRSCREAVAVCVIWPADHGPATFGYACPSYSRSGGVVRELQQAQIGNVLKVGLIHCPKLGVVNDGTRGNSNIDFPSPRSFDFPVYIRCHERLRRSEGNGFAGWEQRLLSSNLFRHPWSTTPLK